MEGGRPAPSALFREDGNDTFAFEILPERPAPIRAFPFGIRQTTEEMVSILQSPVLQKKPPSGYLDIPKEGQVFSSSEITGIGWAECEAGIDRVEVLLDGKFATLAVYGIPRPDVLKVLPTVPCGENCGYWFRLENCSPGRHSLGIILKAKNGKVTALAPKTVTVRA